LNSRRLFERLKQGHVRNVAFRDFVVVVERFGFRKVRQEGSHQAFSRTDVAELLNLQPVRGEVKPYQIRQFLRLVEKYNLQLENPP